MGTRASCGTRAAVLMVRHSQPVDKRAGESNQTLLVGPITCVDVCVCVTYAKELGHYYCHQVSGHDDTLLFCGGKKTIAV